MSIEAGGDYFLAKPIHVRELFNALEKHLDLTWNYEEVAMTATSTAALASSSILSSSEIVAPAPRDLQVLLELAQEGRLKKLAEVAGQIVSQDDRYQLFIQQILNLAKQFQSEKIEQLIQQHLTKNL